MRFPKLITLVLVFSFPNISFSQTPTKVLEIESILVDGCAGSDEGRNEMVTFICGPNNISIYDIRVDGAGSTGVITTGNWPNTNNSFLGWAAPGTMATEVAQINATITNCGYLIEPMDDTIPSGKKCLIITSTEFSPTAHDFSTLIDTLYVVFQSAGNTQGHFVNYGTSSERTLRLYHLISFESDTVIYDRSLLVNQLGNPGGQDGAGVRYTWPGVPTYYNDGCQAPYVAVSAAWTNPGTMCQTDAPIDLSLFITGSTGGTWTGTGVTGSTFDPSGLSGNISVSYIVGVDPCADTVMHDIIVEVPANATITPAGPFCSSDPALNLSAVDPGGVWSGNGITSPSLGTFDPATAGAGTHTIMYTFNGACYSADTISIEVILSADATILPAGPFCILDAPTNLSAVDNGGIWSGTGITDPNNGTFDPGTSGAGTYTVTYGIAGQCGDTATTVITVDPQADATITPAGPYCDNVAAVTLTAAETGGTWSGTGITNSTSGTFNPSTAGSGLHEIIYTISGSCGDADTIEIRVWESPDIVVSGINESCIDENDGMAWVEIIGGTSPYTILWQTGAGTDSISDLSPGIYGVLITDANSCITTDSIMIYGSSDPCYTPHVYVPNIFSPNDDGNNDVLLVHGLGIESIKLLIYDRWGEKVFESNSIDYDWDGTYNNAPANPDVYIYHLNVTFEDGNQLEQNGNITLIR